MLIPLSCDAASLPYAAALLHAMDVQLCCRMLGTPFAADLESRHCFAVLPGASTVVSCGYWDNTIRCYTTHDGKLLQVMIAQAVLYPLACSPQIIVKRSIYMDLLQASLAHHL